MILRFNPQAKCWTCAKTFLTFCKAKGHIEQELNFTHKKIESQKWQKIRQIYIKENDDSWRIFDSFEK